MSAVEKVLEETSDVIEETLDTLEHVKPTRFNLNGTTKGQQLALLAGAAFFGSVIGATGMYFYIRKGMASLYEEIANAEVAEAKEYYANLYSHIREKPASPEEVLAELHGDEEGTEAAKAHARYLGEDLEVRSVSIDPEQGPAGGIDLVEPVVEKHNIFTDSQPADPGVFNYQDELKMREENPERPYVLSQEEFFEGEPEYEQASLTYFEGDDTLVDDQSVVVVNTDATIGDDNLTKFGYGSNDDNIVYVRNDYSETDFEITRSQGKYSKEVLGLEDEDEHELKHSHQRRMRRPRDDDDE